MGDKREVRVAGLSTINVPAARRDFREGRVAPVDVLHVCCGLHGTAALAAVADLQQGLITSGQLGILGVSRSAVSRQAAGGLLTPVHRGVYLVARAALTPRGRLLAAVLATGDGAVLFGRSALELWGALPAEPGPCHVCAPKHRRDHAGVDVHQASPFPADLCAIDRIPLTAPARSLLDFATSGQPDELERALDELRAGRLLRDLDLERLQEAAPGHRGWKPLGFLLRTEHAPGFSRSEGERRMRALIREAELGSPLRNVTVGDWEVDFLWPDHRLVVEIDGYAFHSGRRAFERDRRKQTELQDLGFEVLRFTWRQITRQPYWVVARLAARLEARRAP